MQQRVFLSKPTSSQGTPGSKSLGVKAEVGQHQVNSSAKGRAGAGGPSPWAWAYVLASCTVGPLLWAATSRWPCPSRCQPCTPSGSSTPGGRREAASAVERVAYLDLWRVLCVTVMVVSHAGGDLEAYVEYNMLGGQQWVLPIVLLVSGTCYGRSPAEPLASVARLLTYFAVGSAMNWLAALATGVHWWEQVAARGVTFQMFYVLGLAAAVLALAPLKAMLIARKEGATALQRFGAFGVALSAVLFGTVLAVCLDWRRLETLQVQLLRVFAEGLFTVLLPVAGLSMLSKEWHDLVGWAMLAWIYATRIANPEPRPGTEFHLFELFAFALVVQQVPLRGQAEVGMAMARWWPVLCFVCGFLLHPGLRLRLDLFPPSSLVERSRHYLVEIIAVMAFTAIPAAGPERTLVLPDALRNQLPWANQWALFAYCSHYAIYRLVQTQPLGVVLVFAAALPFALAARWLQPSEDAAEPAGTVREESPPARSLGQDCSVHQEVVK